MKTYYDKTLIDLIKKKLYLMDNHAFKDICKRSYSSFKIVLQVLKGECGLKVMYPISVCLLI